MESQEAGFPPFPHSLEIPLGFPHSHGLDCGHVSKVNNKRKARKPDLRPFHRKGPVTDVSGPKCNGCCGTLIPQQVWFPCISVKRRDCFFWVPASRGGRCPPGKARRDVWWKTARPGTHFFLQLRPANGVQIALRVRVVGFAPSYVVQS